ncbi:MAG: TlpA family protein disulfide reductase, partial [Deltaproteobacteria bacterium]|nr:TlpA family protein disulfide reductase [Deltaproteobacteria bacterium]
MEAGPMRFHPFLLKGVLLFFFSILVLSGCGGKKDSYQKAPDFSLQDLEGNTFTLSEHRGKIILLDFWATWCQPCRMAIPEMVDLQRKYKDQGVMIVGISVDDPQQVNNRYLAAFKEKFRMNYIILMADRQVTGHYFGSGR